MLWTLLKWPPVPQHLYPRLLKGPPPCKERLVSRPPSQHRHLLLGLLKPHLVQVHVLGVRKVERSDEHLHTVTP